MSQSKKQNLQQGNPQGFWHAGFFCGRNPVLKCFDISVSRLVYLIAFFIWLPFLLGCKGGEITEKTAKFQDINEVPAYKWEKLAQKKIFFGHQSVGFNIIEGIRDVTKENPYIKLNIMKTSNRSDFNAGIFAHSTVGKNLDPESKIDSFSRILEKEIGDQLDFAFLKFCFVDVVPRTDVHSVFSEYKNSIDLLKAKFPETTFIHVTVPLTSEGTGMDFWIRKIKNFVKKIIKETNYYDNQKRNEYNEILLNEYDGKEPVFDLARIESTFPDGTQASCLKNGKLSYSLVPDYTHDSAHLNDKGRRIVAEQLLIFLSQLIE